MALDEGRYADVCAYLQSTGFSEVVCAWLVDTVEANGDRSLTTDRLERFLRAHQVRRTSGTIVGWYDEGRNEYEARIGGRPSILVATETEYATTGRFTMWAQRIGTSTEVLVSGREVEVPVFREWPLYEVLIETARARGEAARPAALAAFRELVRGWESDYCYTLPEESSCYVDPNAPLPNVAPPTAETATSTLRAMIPSSLSSAGVAPVVFDVARFLHASNLRYDQLAEFPTTRLSELREDPEVRGKAWVATGTVSQVRASDNAVVFWRNDTCTYAVVPNAPVIPNRAEVRFAGIAVQHYRWPNLVGRPQDCLVAVGYFAPR
ncbi:MAG: hypothetical protein H6721_07375 [Sandaracinus sp.]|nr:hypothetical protein [Sandaracinus sp.]MCB9616439.1 hypothetical protein [Sandaracinus sp.]MCB9631939.1 hypothetical protein [Sandaracinus sp.]